MTEEQNKTAMPRNNRTWLCTVLFMDIVGYSKLSVDQQMMVKQHFSTLVSDSLRSLPSEDCIKLDTGDGLAMCYLGAPEDVLYVAVGLRDAFVDVNAICGTCYSVDDGRAAEVAAVAPSAIETTAGRRGVDVRAGVLSQLRAAGVEATWDSRCTAEEQSLYSYRRDGVTGRQALAIVRRSA